MKSKKAKDESKRRRVARRKKTLRVSVKTKDITGKKSSVASLARVQDKEREDTLRISIQRGKRRSLELKKNENQKRKEGNVYSATSTDFPRASRTSSRENQEPLIKVLHYGA